MNQESSDEGPRQAARKAIDEYWENNPGADELPEALQQLKEKYIDGDTPGGDSPVIRVTVDLGAMGDCKVPLWENDDFDAERNTPHLTSRTGSVWIDDLDETIKRLQDFKEEIQG